MKPQLFEIGETVQLEFTHKEGIVVEHALRDEMWSERHLYRIKFKTKMLFFTKTETKWILQPFINKLNK